MTGAAGRKETVACSRVRLPERAWVATYAVIRWKRSNVNAILNEIPMS